MQQDPKESDSNPKGDPAGALAARPGPAAGSIPKRVWIDLDNTPHVPFFAPIIRALEGQGHEVLVTARDAFQVCALADYLGVRYRRVGRHYGANKFMKVAGTLWRALQLLPFAVRERPDIAVSHGSRPMLLLSALIGTPSMFLFDYEHSSEIPFVRPWLGVVPESIDDPHLAKGFRYGLRSYRGLKEDVYADSFRPDATILGDLGVTVDEILVTIRPPATEAHYHNPESEPLFVEVVDFLAETPGLRMVILPRNVRTQGDFIRHTWPRLCEERRIIIPSHAVDGLNLVWFSDLVISGGGTMNREAAALDVPVYSIFRGKLGAVDRYLARDGRLVLIEAREDIRSKVRPVKRSKGLGPGPAVRPALQEILSAIRELIDLADERRTS
jgi:uncharacterized protein